MPSPRSSILSNQPPSAVWIADLLPHELGPAIGAMIAQGLEAMKKTLER